MIRLPSAEDPAVSVIVLLDGAVELAERCLRAIAAADDAVPFETVLLLNDPDPALEDFIRKGTSGGKVVLLRANAGPAVGWNLAATVCTAPRLATLHEDSEPDAGWLAPLCEAMTEYGAGAVGSRLYNHDGSVQNCGWVLFADGSHQPLNQVSAPEIAASTEPTSADMLSGASTLLDREAVRAAGGWDERFHPAVFSDIDISLAMWRQGRPVLSVPASKVRHESGAFDRRPNTVLTGPRLRRFLFERHRDRFLAKWGVAVQGLAPPPRDAEPGSVREAVQAALPHTRARAKEVAASGHWEAVQRVPASERRFTGIPSPVVAENGRLHAVAPEVEEALGSAESELVEGYCRWLVGVEAETHDLMLQAHDVIRHRDREIADLRTRVRELEQAHDWLVGELDGIRATKAWRLRTFVRRLLRRERQ